MAAARQRDPSKKSRRRVVEACHGGFNGFCKLLELYEKLDCSFVARNRFAASIIAFREVPVRIKSFKDKFLQAVLHIELEVSRQICDAQ